MYDSVNNNDAELEHHCLQGQMGIRNMRWACAPFNGQDLMWNQHDTDWLWQQIKYAASLNAHSKKYKPPVDLDTKLRRNLTLKKGHNIRCPQLRIRR